MFTALRATSLTLAALLRQKLEDDPTLKVFFDSSSGGNMVVTLNTPQEMARPGEQGLSVWLYRIERDEQRLNAPRERIRVDQELHTPLPLRLHYLMAPIVESADTTAGPELEQAILGKVLQTLHDHPKVRGVDLKDDLAGTAIELTIRLEPQGLEEITRLWDALERSCQLCVSYEVGVVLIQPAREPLDIAPVEVVVPELGVASLLETSS
jgi:hypothetical protein